MTLQVIAKLSASDFDVVDIQLFDNILKLTITASFKKLPAEFS